MPASKRDQLCSVSGNIWFMLCFACMSSMEPLVEVFSNTCATGAGIGCLKFVGVLSTGHYLSASALMWASTHNESLQEKMTALVRALKECQMSTGSGYLSAFPSEFFDRFEAIEPVWAPYYTIHKVCTATSKHWKRYDTFLA